MDKAVVAHFSEVSEQVMEDKEVKGTSLFRLLGPEDGFLGYAMRVFTLEPGGHTPRHRHDWVHINLIVSGEGRLLIEDEWQKISQGFYAFVPSSTLHQFENTGDEPLVFMCIIPEEKK